MSDPDKSYHWVAVVLRTPAAVTVVSTTGPRPESLLVGEVTYREYPACELGFFYDWLRTEPGTVVGMRFYLEEECPAVLAALRALPYVVYPNEVLIELYFSDVREHEPELSGDQEFLGNAVMVSASGGYALLFGSSFLSAEELGSIRRVPAYTDGALL